MARLLFIQLKDLEGKNTEARASIYKDRKELPEGCWLVDHAVGGEPEVMSQWEMPEHWRDQLKRAGQWAEKHLD